MKKKIALAAPFVITITAACGKDQKPEPEISHNPPAYDLPATVDAQTPPTPSVTATTAEPVTMTHNPPPTPRLSDYPKVMNPKDKDGRAIFLSDGAKCYVELPFAPLKPGQDRPPGTPPPEKTVTCPKELTGPVWESCKGGTIQSTNDGKNCICFHMGNPPPPPLYATCP